MDGIQDLAEILLSSFKTGIWVFALMDALYLSAGRWAYREERELNDLYATERNLIFFIRDSPLLLFTQEKTSKGQVNPFLRASW